MIRIILIRFSSSYDTIDHKTRHHGKQASFVTPSLQVQLSPQWQALRIDTVRIPLLPNLHAIFRFDCTYKEIQKLRQVSFQTIMICMKSDLVTMAVLLIQFRQRQRLRSRA